MIVALGDALLDIVCQTRSPIRYGTDCFVQATISPGGSAANFAVWVARCGGQAGLIAKVGDDILGRLIVDDLRAKGVCTAVARAKKPTGVTMCLVDQTGERTMFVARGATSTLCRDDLDYRLLDQARLLHVTAYSFFEDEPREAALTAMRYVKKRGGLLSLDPSSYGYLSELGSDAFYRLAAGVDLFFPNLHEGRVLTGAEEPKDVLEALLERFPLVALKLGSGGAIAGTRTGVHCREARKVPVADTTGAGDAFAAAFIVQWLATGDVAAALEAGASLAEGVIQVPGARFMAGPLPP
ncbi:MAG: sugar kinase [Chloroflexi bacterium]|nr:sugar kinase [Chloroflexota bacterium]